MLWHIVLQKSRIRKLFTDGNPVSQSPISSPSSFCACVLCFICHVETLAFLRQGIASACVIHFVSAPKSHPGRTGWQLLQSSRSRRLLLACQSILSDVLQTDTASNENQKTSATYEPTWSIMAQRKIPVVLHFLHHMHSKR